MGCRVVSCALWGLGVPHQQHALAPALNLRVPKLLAAAGDCRSLGATYGRAEQAGYIVDLVFLRAYTKATVGCVNGVLSAGQHRAPQQQQQQQGTHHSSRACRLQAKAGSWHGGPCLSWCTLTRQPPLAAQLPKGTAGAGCREASGGSDFAGALWLAGQCAEEVAPLHPLRVGQQLRQAVDQRYVGTLQALEAALTAACTDFQPEHYTQVRWEPCARGWRCPCRALGLGCPLADTSGCLPDDCLTRCPSSPLQQTGLDGGREVVWACARMTASAHCIVIDAVWSTGRRKP